jgi:hypothetical protein
LLLEEAAGFESELEDEPESEDLAPSELLLLLPSDFSPDFSEDFEEPEAGFAA